MLWTAHSVAQTANQIAEHQIAEHQIAERQIVERQIVEHQISEHQIAEPGTEDSPAASGQTDPNGKWNIADAPVPRIASGGGSLLTRFALDQKAIWTSPFHLRRADAFWMLPAMAGTGLLLASDSWLSKQVPTGEIARSRTLSNYGVFSLAGAAGGSFLWGKMTHNDHASETGALATEAAINAAAVDFALRSMFPRQRPYDGSGAGHFFAGGSSFPSEHATVSWAIAGVVAHEYPGTLTRIISYGLASAVTVARVTGKEHFPSDAVVGGSLGYFIAQHIYHRRRDPQISEAAWESPIDSIAQNRSQSPDQPRNPRSMGSPYVPLDSWVYPAMERLVAMGEVQTAYLGIRPWSRMECARLLEEVQDERRASGDGGEGEAAALYAALASEFTAERARLDGAANLALRLDSIHTRFTAISGVPLRDGYHFAQTLVNDFGRPFGEGFNQVTGIAGEGVAGILSFSFQGEYQHAPSVASSAPSVLQAAALEDGIPSSIPDGSLAINRFRLVEGSIGVTLHDARISFGRQSLWLGPGESGALLMSDNAQPFTALTMDHTSPFELPLLSHFLGPVRMISFLGQLAGQNWVYSPPPSEGLNSSVLPQYLVGPSLRPQPFLHGNKISFHPSSNLEFGMGVTAIFAGPGLPFTWHEFFRSYYGHNANTATNPAKRFSSFDFTYRVPGLRKWLTLYSDSMVGDEISPIGSTRPMLNPGIYLPQLPRLPKLELRVEGFKAEPRLGTMYFDRRYRSGYTNDGNLMGSWIGRQALGGQAWLKYSFRPRTSVQLGYRHQEVDHFLAGGGRLNDFSASADCRLGPQLAISGRAQYERWNFPVLAAQTQANFTTQLQFTYFPAWHPGK